jgi:osmotically-inducible protein OsmY
MRMSGRNLLLGLLTVAVLNGGVSACAVIRTYHKCGWAGCSGDADLTAKVQNQFERYAALQPPNLIRVQTYDRVVYLSGIVNTTLPRDLAASVAGRVSGVRKVVDSITLDYQGR